MIFNRSKKKLKALVKTNRYKKSKYRIVKINNKWGLQKQNRFYMDIKLKNFYCEYDDPNIIDCFGRLSTILKLFDFYEPFVEIIITEEQIK